MRGTEDHPSRGASPPPTALTVIREATRALHAAVEANPLMAPMTEGRVTPAQYRAALAALHGFYRPCEEEMFERHPSIAKTLGIRPKLPALSHDLAGLGLAAREIAALPVCADIPDIGSWERALGMAYVLEGATLGGQVVMRRIGPCLGRLVEIATDFHNFQGQEAGPHWRRFQAALFGQLDHSALAQAEAAESAAATFRALNAWLDLRAAAGAA